MAADRCFNTGLGLCSFWQDVPTYTLKTLKQTQEIAHHGPPQNENI
jgi:hypothetical protein